MVDRLFTEPRLAALYDELCPWDARGDMGWYLDLVMPAGSVLDVGCGTGQLLRRARDDDHTGRLCGLDPAPGMLAVARRRPDVEWVQGDLSTVRYDREFDLVVMSGHAFQVFLTDDEIRSTLAAVRDALTEDGRFAFETRNPRARAWESWTPEHAVEVRDPLGAVVRCVPHLDRVEGQLVSFSWTYTNPVWERPEVSHSTLRFLDVEPLAAFLAEAGLVVNEQFGDWDQSPLTESSPEIITIVSRT